MPTIDDDDDDNDDDDDGKIVSDVLDDAQTKRTKTRLERPLASKVIASNLNIALEL